MKGFEVYFFVSNVIRAEAYDPTTLLFPTAVTVYVTRAACSARYPIYHSIRRTRKWLRIICKFFILGTTFG